MSKAIAKFFYIISCDFLFVHIQLQLRAICNLRLHHVKHYLLDIFGMLQLDSVKNSCMVDVEEIWIDFQMQNLVQINVVSSNVSIEMLWSVFIQQLAQMSVVKKDHGVE